MNVLLEVSLGFVQPFEFVRATNVGAFDGDTSQNNTQRQADVEE